MNIKELLNYGIQLLKENNIDDYAIKAKVLLQYVMNENKEYIIVNYDKEIEKLKENEYKKFVEEMVNGRPLQYITNHQEFMNLDLYVNENVLIPQPDTEILVEEVIKELDKIRYVKNRINILDLCTRSGAIAISLYKYLQKLQQENENLQYQVYGVDISKEALEVANRNANLNNSKVEFILSDMFNNLQELKKEKFDIIVSNPPYIEKDQIRKLSKDVQCEPHLALDGGKDGLDFYRIIADNSYLYLKEKGKIFIEIGYKQRKLVEEIFNKKNVYEKVECIKDFSGNDRVLKIN